MAKWKNEDPSIGGIYFCNQHMPSNFFNLEYSKEGFEHTEIKRYVDYTVVSEILDDSSRLFTSERDLYNMEDEIAGIFTENRSQTYYSYIEITLFLSKIGLLIKKWLDKPNYRYGEYFEDDVAVGKFFQYFKQRIKGLSTPENEIVKK